MSRLLKTLARLVPKAERAEWVNEWAAEWAHAKAAKRRSLLRIAAGALEDALRRMASRWAPGPIGQDLRFAARSLRRNPGYTTVAVLTLALGLGANTAIYSIVDATMIRDLPIDDPDRVVVAVREKDGRQGPTSAPNFLDWESASASFAGLSALQSWSATLTGAGSPIRVTRNRVSADFFTTLEIDAVLGRTFVPGEDQPGAEPVVVLTHELWLTAFGEDRDVLGRSVEINGVRHQVVGVLPAGLRIPPFTAQMFVPWEFLPDALEARGRNNLWAIGRLADGVTFESASSEMRGIGERLAAEYPMANEGWDIALEPIHEFAVGSARTSLILLLGSVGLLLLIACVNVANLTLARGISRERELAVRVSLGAGRGRLAFQIVAETLMLSVLGGVVGLGVSALAIGPIAALLPARLSGIGNVQIDPSVIAFAAILATATGVIAGLLPALRLSRSAMRRGASVAGTLRRRGDAARTRNGLVAAEFALAMTLLVGAGLFLRSLSALYAVDLGLDPTDLTTFGVTLPAEEYDSPALTIAGVNGILSELEAVPGVTGAAAISDLPLRGGGLSSSVVLEGHSDEQQGTNGPSAGIRVVTPGYFQLTKIPVVAGRLFGPEDRADSHLTAIINQAAAERWWPGDEALGKELWYAMDAEEEPLRRTIIGVVSDVRSRGPTAPVMPEVYQPHTQTTALWRWFGQDMSYLAHRPNQSVGARQVQAVLSTVDPDLPAANVTTLEAMVDRSVATPRVHGTLIGAFALIALLLAGIGIYGVMAFTVRQRTREIGLRIAIGADGPRILKQVLGTGLRIAGLGVMAGTLAAFAVSRTLQSLLYEVQGSDPVTYIAVASVLTASTLLACLIPAVRAARTDPAEALQAE